MALVNWPDMTDEERALLDGKVVQNYSDFFNDDEALAYQERNAAASVEEIREDVARMNTAP